jgi:dTDP-4-dehydrorhamnose 3,5-epimerase
VNIEIRPLKLQGVYEIVPPQIIDGWGFVSETWSAHSFEHAHLPLEFVQDNHEYSAQEGVFRGLHFQLPPFAQDKLVRVMRGAILAVAVDIRRNSPTFGEWVALELSARRWNQMLILKGFAHGALSLEADTEVIYKLTNPYSREHERTIRYDDPEIGLVLPIPASELILSDGDRMAKGLRQVEQFHSQSA